MCLFIQFLIQNLIPPQFACYLEECAHKSQTPAERHDHCIMQHKFPHDFRFDGFNHKKAMINSIKQRNSHTTCDKKSTIVQASKLAVNQVHDEDIVLEDKSIVLMAQRKPMTTFSFGHRKAKTFGATDDDKSYAKVLTKNAKGPKKAASSSTLECERMVEDLIDSLPQWNGWAMGDNRQMKMFSGFINTFVFVVFSSLHFQTTSTRNRK